MCSSDLLPLIWGWVFVGTQRRASSIRDAFETVHTQLIDKEGNEYQKSFECFLDCTDEVKGAEVATFLGFSVPGWEKEPGPLFVFARVHTHRTTCKHIQGGFAALLCKQQEKKTIDDGEHVGDVEVAENSSVPDVPSGGIGVSFIIAAFIGVFLQWGTTGSAILIAYM